MRPAVSLAGAAVARVEFCARVGVTREPPRLGQARSSLPPGTSPGGLQRVGPGPSRGGAAGWEWARRGEQLQALASSASFRTMCGDATCGRVGGFIFRVNHVEL